MCFVLEWSIGFVVIAIGAWLSQYITMLSLAVVTVLMNCLRCNISLVSSLRAMYPASAVDSATHFYFWTCHEMMQLLR